MRLSRAQITELCLQLKLQLWKVFMFYNRANALKFSQKYNKKHSQVVLIVNSQLCSGSFEAISWEKSAIYSWKVPALQFTAVNFFCFWVDCNHVSVLLHFLHAWKCQQNIVVAVGSGLWINAIELRNFVFVFKGAIHYLS